MTTPYKIGEAAALLNLKTYVLRFWETEFPDIVPLRTEKGQRLYTEEHLALLERIRYLLHDRGLTIGGARKVLAEEKERGLVYEFCVPGALPSAPKTFLAASAADSLLEEAEDDAGPGEAGDRQRDAGLAAAGLNGRTPGALAEDSTGPASAPPLENTSSPLRSGQYNLPGLDELVAMRLAALDSQAGGEYVLPEESGETAFMGEQRGRDALPLFLGTGTASAEGGDAVSVRALLERGGCTCPQAGDAPAKKEIPATDHEASAGAVPAGEGLSGMSLHAIRAELEEVAAILRRRGPPSEESSPGLTPAQPQRKA